MRAPLLLAMLAAACSDRDEAVGVTEWAVSILSPSQVAASSATGFLALRDPAGIAVIEPSGLLRWRVGDLASSPVCVALDEAGDLYLIDGGPGTRFLRRYATGEKMLAWERTIEVPEGAQFDGPCVVADGVLTLFAVTTAPVDLGGGPVGDVSDPAIAARFDLDGQPLTSRVIENAYGRPVVAAGGPVAAYVTEAGFSYLVALDARGDDLWRDGYSAHVLALSAADDGELTLLIDGQSDAREVVRLDADRRQRWSVVARDGSMTALGDGSVVLVSGEGLVNEVNVGVLDHVDRNGDSIDQELFPDPVSIAIANTPAPDAYWIVGRPDASGQAHLHDTTVDVIGDAFLARRRLVSGRRAAAGPPAGGAGSRLDRRAAGRR